MNANAILLGMLTAILVIGVMFVVSMLVINGENKQIITTNITVKEKLCEEAVFGVGVSKIKTDGGIMYFIPNNECKNKYGIGEKYQIKYNHICNLPVKEPGPPDYACFNRVVGDYP